MVIADHNFRGHVNVLIYTVWVGGGGGDFFNFGGKRGGRESEV
jgi:hypothetical protein